MEGEGLPWGNYMYTNLKTLSRIPFLELKLPWMSLLFIYIYFLTIFWLQFIRSRIYEFPTRVCQYKTKRKLQIYQPTTTNVLYVSVTSLLSTIRHHYIYKRVKQSRLTQNQRISIKRGYKCHHVVHICQNMNLTSVSYNLSNVGGT